MKEIIETLKKANNEGTRAPYWLIIAIVVTNLIYTKSYA